MVESIRQSLPDNVVEPELLWASWTTHRPGKALPMSVWRDDVLKQFVLAVRGTADVSSIIDDLGVEPKFWDPLGMAGPSPNTSPPFDEQHDFFVPGVWLAISEEMMAKLGGKGFVDRFRARPDYRVVITGHSLGAGVASLLALHMRSRLPEAQRVHYVGFEPPGCCLCPRLSQLTQQMGWISVVCAYDWVPRLSIRNAEKLRELALDELERCDRSKFQLSLLVVAGIIDRGPFVCRCLRKCLSAPFRCFAGGSFGQPPGYWSYTHGYTNLEPLQLPRQGLLFPLMLPPGDVVYFKPLKTTWRCGFLQKDVEWCAQWADPEDIQQEFIVAPRVIELHVPWVYEHAIGTVANRFRLTSNSSEVCSSARSFPFRTPRTGGRRPEAWA